jgi:hypothetical protein
LMNALFTPGSFAESPLASVVISSGYTRNAIVAGLVETHSLALSDFLVGPASHRYSPSGLIPPTLNLGPEARRVRSKEDRKVLLVEAFERKGKWKKSGREKQGSEINVDRRAGPSSMRLRGWLGRPGQFKGSGRRAGELPFASLPPPHHFSARSSLPRPAQLQDALLHHPDTSYYRLPHPATRASPSLRLSRLPLAISLEWTKHLSDLAGGAQKTSGRASGRYGIRWERAIELERALSFISLGRGFASLFRTPREEGGPH